MANIRLKELVEANVDPKLVARSKETGKLVYFKTPQTKAAAMKAGTHSDPKSKKGDEPKADAKPNNMFGKDYNKDRGSKAAPKDDTDWISNLDSIDTSDVKGKADPNADSFTHDDVFGATFKDPQTGKTTTVGDAYEKEDNSPAYKKAFAYVAQFNPDDEAVMGTQAYADLQKKEPKAQLPKKASELDYKHAETLEKAVNAETGLSGYAQTDDNSGAIMYNAGKGEMPTYTLYMGSNVDYGKPDEFRVSLEPTYGNDPSKLQGKIDKSFKSAEDANTFMIAVAKKYKKELEMDDEDTKAKSSSKLTSMLPKDAADGPKINGKDQKTPNRMFDKKKPFDPKEIEKDVTDMLKSDGYEVEHQWGTNDYFLNISKKDKKGKEIENYTVQKNPKTGMASVWDAKAYQWVVQGEPSISRLYDTIGQIPDFRED
jgi:hypothetical protein